MENTARKADGFILDTEHTEKTQSTQRIKQNFVSSVSTL